MGALVTKMASCVNDGDGHDSDGRVASTATSNGSELGAAAIERYRNIHNATKTGNEKQMQRMSASHHPQNNQKHR